MLGLYLREDDTPNGFEVITDVERAFLRVKLTGSFLERLFIKNIEQGEYKDSLSFIDRFGDKLDRSCLSTGCKAAIVVTHNPTKLVDLRECGMNAINSIVSNCTEGNILTHYDGINMLGSEDLGGWNTNDKIDVMFNGVHFTSARNLQEYMETEWADKMERRFEEKLRQYKAKGGIM